MLENNNKRSDLYSILDIYAVLFIKIQVLKSRRIPFAIEQLQPYTLRGEAGSSTALTFLQLTEDDNLAKPKEQNLTDERYFFAS